MEYSTHLVFVCIYHTETFCCLSDSVELYVIVWVKWAFLRYELIDLVLDLISLWSTLNKMRLFCADDGDML